MKSLFALFLFLLTNAGQAWFEQDSRTNITYEIQNILQDSFIEKEQFSPNNEFRASLYRSRKSLEEGEIANEILKITSLGEPLWLYEGYGLIFNKFEFISDNKLIIELCSSTACSTVIFDKEMDAFTQLGGGGYSLVNDNRIRLSGNKFYDALGAFWVDMIVDAQGNVIEVLSPNTKYLDKCIPLSLILDHDKKYPKLIQSIGSCIHVGR